MCEVFVKHNHSKQGHLFGHLFPTIPFHVDNVGEWEGNPMMPVTAVGVSNAVRESPRRAGWKFQWCSPW